MEHNPSSHVVMFYFMILQDGMGSDSAERKSESIHSRCGKERTSSFGMLATILLRFTVGDRRHVELTCGKREPIHVKTSQITLRYEHVKNSFIYHQQRNRMDWKGLPP